MTENTTNEINELLKKTLEKGAQSQYSKYIIYDETAYDNAKKKEVQEFITSNFPQKRRYDIYIMMACGIIFVVELLLILSVT